MNSNQTSPTERQRPTKIVRFDKGYFKTVPGILKLAQISCNMISFGIKVTSLVITSVFYDVLYWFATIISALLLFVYTFHIVEKFDRWPWHKVEFFYCAIVALVYVGSSIFTATITERFRFAVGVSVGYTIMFFAFCAIIAYSFDACLNFKGWKSGLHPQ